MCLVVVWRSMGLPPGSFVRSILERTVEITCGRLESGRRERKFAGEAMKAVDDARPDIEAERHARCRKQPRHHQRIVEQRIEPGRVAIGGVARSATRSAC